MCMILDRGPRQRILHDISSIVCYGILGILGTHDRIHSMTPYKELYKNFAILTHISGGNDLPCRMSLFARQPIVPSRAGARLRATARAHKRAPDLRRAWIAARSSWVAIMLNFAHLGGSSRCLRGKKKKKCIAPA